MATDINLERYFRVAVRWLWLIVLSTALAAGVSYKVSKTIPAVYRTQTMLMVGDDVSNPNLSLEEINLSGRLANGYAAMVNQQAVLEGTVQALHIPTSWQALGSHILVAHLDQSQYLTIYVTDTDPRQAKVIADEVARQLILHSPTQREVQQVQQRQQFVQQQLDELQKDIQLAQQDLNNRQAQLGKQTSARDVLDTKDAIKADEDKITTWRSTYAKLLAPSQGLPPNSLRVIQTADVPSQPVSPNVRSNVIFAGAAGLILALAAVLLIEYFNDTIATTEDLEQAVKVPILGAVADMGRITKQTDALVTIRDTASPVAEAYRFLRTSLKFATADSRPEPLIVTSPGPGEGKSITSANLAVSFARVGKRVVLVDADLRNPTLHLLFEVPNELGLTSLVAGLNDSNATDEIASSSWSQSGFVSGADVSTRVGRHLVPTPVAGLSLLPAGPSPVTTTAAEVMGSSAMKLILESLQDLADVVIVDSPPVLPVADSITLAASGPCVVVLVVDLVKSRYEAVRLAIEMLRAANVPVLGLVANRAPNTALARYQYGYPVKMVQSIKPKRLLGIW